jgi:pimeloyl-ACP methyl ester carboxylesterase
VHSQPSVPEERDPRELIDAAAGDRGRRSDTNVDGREAIDLVYERRGVGEPLLLLHGLGSRWQVFEPVLDLLAREFELWALDMPGFGASPPATRALSSLGGLADEVLAWMRTRGLEGCHAAGNSTGGGVALELAARGAVKSVVALAPIGFWSARERAFCQTSLRSTRMLARQLRPLAPWLLRIAPGRALVFAQFAAHPTRITPHEALGDVEAFIDASSFDDVCAAFSGYLAPTSAADHVPVTIAWGTKDRLLLPRQLDRARRRLPRAHHARIAGAGHLATRDDPQAVAELIRSAVSLAGRTAPATKRL